MDELAASPPSSIKPARITWPGGPSKKQFFSLPSSIIYYILKNPSSPAVYIKLIKSCKFFFEGNAILVIATMYGNAICSNEHSNGGQECCVKFDINKTSSKIWLTHELCLKEDSASDFTALLCPKLFRSDVDFVRIVEKTIMFDDFKSLISSAVIVSLCCCKIMYNDGSVVMLEKIMEPLSMATIHFHIFCDDDFPIVNGSTMKKVAQLENFQQLDSFDMLSIPEIVLIEDLSNIIEDHENICFQFHFSLDISDGYMEQLDNLIDTVIESEVPNRMIWYEGQDKEKLKIMKSRFVDGDMLDDDEEMEEEENGDDFDGDELMDDE